MNNEKIDVQDFSLSEFYGGNDYIRTAAKEKFGIEYLFPWQRLVISNIIEAFEYQKMLKIVQESGAEILREEVEDDSFCKGRQIVLLPTGAGKSLCFQLPSLFLEGPTLVIYPLLALMSDQLRRMQAGNLGCVLFRGGMSSDEVEENFRAIRSGARIIIANPEVLQGESLLARLCETGISHIAIDEAHCVSEWGDSFRPAYLGLGEVIKRINPPVITAFTATASPVVLQRISAILFENQAHIVRSESDRQNIHYYVRNACAKKKEVLLLAKKELRPMIVFCGTRYKAEDMARELNVCFGSKIAKFYHAGLERNEKEAVEKWFFESKDGILCATCAYGMGVDKKDIKTVVHIQVPDTAEAYIQEAGRGGRDGSVAKAILLWSLDDALAFSVFPEGSRKAYMREFAMTDGCRRKVLLKALGAFEEAETCACSGCDFCERKTKLQKFEGLPLSKRILYKRSFSALHEVADWQEMYGILKKRKNCYSEVEIEDEIISILNKKSLKQIGTNIWTHQDAVEVVKQLKNSGKIEADNFLWKGKFRVVKEKS